MQTKKDIVIWQNGQKIKYFITLSPTKKYGMKCTKFIPRVENIPNAYPLLRGIFGKAERILLGKNWQKHPIYFTIFVEFGKYGVFQHYHILMTKKITITLHKLQMALQKACDKMNLDPRSICVKRIKGGRKRVIRYCLKEIPPCTDKIKSDRIISSEILFDKIPPLILPDKPKKLKRKRNQTIKHFWDKLVKKITYFIQIVKTLFMFCCFFGVYV